MGQAMGLLALGVLAAAWHTGNNLLFFGGGILVALLALDQVLGAWNLRGLYATRRLPEELWAGRATDGALVLENPRRFLPSWGLFVSDHADDERRPVPAETACFRLHEGGRVELPARWRFDRRGWVELVSIEISSTFPFGFARRSRTLHSSAEILVYPDPGSLWGTTTPELSPGVTRADASRPGGTGELFDLRPYVPGDALHHIHWPTSARRGQLMSVVRDADVNEEILVTVPDEADPERWEQGIRRACGQILLYTHLGRAVGLHVRSGDLFSPRAGEEQRRRLLAVLASLPEREMPEAPLAPDAAPATDGTSP
jgi:uncharacterized protein (DUF58 family)